MSKKIIKGHALWRQNIGDIPVEVIEEIGEFHGKIYYLVKGLDKSFEGSTGVSEEELVQNDY